jgi:hypothetical protein
LYTQGQSIVSHHICRQIAMGSVILLHLHSSSKLHEALLLVRLQYLAKKNIGCPVKFKFQINISWSFITSIFHEIFGTCTKNICCLLEIKI